MDLITEKWLPVVLDSGERIKVSLTELLDERIVDVAYPRADFQGAAWQMLAGLLQCTVAPDEESEWKRLWKKGLNQSQWEKALRAIAPALQLGDQKPSFLQSFDPLEVETTPKPKKKTVSAVKRISKPKSESIQKPDPKSIDRLLIDAPGDNTLKLNTDHFVKRHTAERICQHCAVMALFTVQTNSPAGGAGYRVGMRGGGPMTTLVVPAEGEAYPLWKKLWLNVLPEENLPEAAQLPLVFPWLTATKTSEKAGNIVTPDNSHLFQAYWGMPRRIELDFTATEAGRCDICGERHHGLFRQIRTKNYGVQYDSWLHPFSPYRQALKDPSAPWLSLKGQPGGLSYKDWMGLLWEGEDKYNKTQPAKIVRAAIGRIARSELWCFGYDMDNAKARCWYQHRVPVLNTDNPEKLTGRLAVVLPVASDALFLLKKALKSAMFANPTEARVDFSMTEIAFWQETEPAFRQLVAVLADDPACDQPDTRTSLLQWEKGLQHYITGVFDRQMLSDANCPDDILVRCLNARQELNRDYRKLKTRKELLLSAGEEKESAMNESITAAPLRVTTQEAEHVILAWFEVLAERNSEQKGQKINGRAWRAELRRAELPYGVMLCEGYHALCGRLAEKLTLSPTDKMALALFASVAAHIKKHNKSASIAAQLGEKLNGSTPCVSSLRFERLLKARQPDELCRLLIQAVKIRDGEGCNVLSLADSLFIWMNEWAMREAHEPESGNPFRRHRVRWANEYLSTSH